MEIKIGSLYVNKTLKYLVPILKCYGKPLEAKINSVFKLAFGIHDTYLDGSEVSENRCIYILCDKEYKKDNFFTTLEWLRCQEYFVNDYIFSSNPNSRFHMIILKFPEPYNNAYDNFLVGKYSKMLPPLEVDNFFLNQEVKSIMKGIKTPINETQLLQEIELVFGVSKDVLEGVTLEELDLPITIKQEVFNYDTKQQGYFLTNINKLITNANI